GHGHIQPARSRRDPQQRVAPYRLSPELESLALQIGRLSRLSRAGRADVADATAAEIRALLDSRIPAQEIPGRLGPPAQVAARFRREWLGRRLWVFRVLRGWKSGLAALFVFVLLLY